MSRQDQDAETQLALQGPKRPRQDDRHAQQAITFSIPTSLASPVTTLNMSTFIRGFGDSVTSWMSNLINQQDGCLRMVAQQLAQTVARSATMLSQNDQARYLRAQLAHREAQFEHVRSERDTHFVQEEEYLLARMHLLSSEAKDRKSISEAEQVLCREPAEAAQHATEVQDAMDKQRSRRDCERVSWNTSSYILHKRDSCN